MLTNSGTLFKGDSPVPVNAALSGKGACQTPLDKTLELGKKLKVEGTPTLFFPSNKRVEGAIDAAELEKLLAG